MDLGLKDRVAVVAASSKGLGKAVALPATSSPRDPHYQEQARELLKKLKP